MNIKGQLRLYLEHKGMTAAELSRKSGVSKQVLSSWQAGARPKDIDMVRKVAQCLGTSVDHLVYGTGIDSDQERSDALGALLSDEWVGGTFEVRLRRVPQTKKGSK